MEWQERLGGGFATVSISFPKFVFMENIIVIVGRTNVGKSMLIMNDTQNTTRDRHYGKGQWTNKHFTVIDTGGYIEGTDDIFEKSIRVQITMALQEASVLHYRCSFSKNNSYKSKL